MMEKLQLSLAEITEISRDRLPSDMCQLELESGYSNTLAGAFSRCLFLVHGKNVGSISHYILASENSTNYLTDLHFDQLENMENKILSISNILKTKKVIVGEIKEVMVKEINLKRMPYILLKGRCKEIPDDPYYEYDTSDVRLLIQDSEESRLVNENGRPVSVDDLNIGSKVLVYIGLYGYGRHFGMEVEGAGLIEK